MELTHSISKSNRFAINNLIDFKEGLKGFVGKGSNIPLLFNSYVDKRKSQEATINITSNKFHRYLQSQTDEDSIIDTLEYIKSHIKEGDKCILVLVEADYGATMTVTKIKITNHQIEQIEVLV